MCHQGGIKSVVWTDVFQTVIIFGGIVVILVKGSIDVGGIGKVVQIASDNGRIITNVVSPDPRVRHTVWGLVISGSVYWMGSHFSQSSVQRIVSIKSEEQARMTFIIATFLTAIYGTILNLTGLVLLAYFFSIECDPLKAGYIQNRNQLMPYFVMQSLSFLPGLPGLYMATIFSGALSTLSSGINSLTANTVEDFLGGVLANKRESTVMAISKCIVCAYGAGIIGLAYLAREMPGPVTQTTYTTLGATCGPLLGIFVLGATFPQANAAGTMFGLLVSLAVNMWMSIGSVLYGAPTPQLPNGPVDQCFAQNASASGDTRNTSWVDHVTSADAAVSSTAAYVTVATTNSTAIGRVFQDSYSLYDVSYVWPPLIGLLVTVLLGLLASIIFGYFQKSKRHSNPRLFFPFVRTFIKFEKVDKEVELLSDSRLKPHSKWPTLNEAAMSVNPVHLSTTDYVTLGIMLMVSLGIGVYFAISGRKNLTKAEYLVGSRRLGALPVCLSLFATFQSAISLLGVPAEVYSYGTMILYSTVAMVQSYLIGIVTVVPLMHPLKITSVNEYLQMRFQSRTVRLVGTLIGVIASISYMTVALLSPALALQTAIDLPLWLSIVLVGAVGTTYTAIGGIKSVVWTDVFQTVIIFGGIVVILLKGSIDVGGIGNVLQIASDNGRIITNDISPDPRVRHTVWGLVISGSMYWTGAHFSQSSVQRIVAIKSEEQARMTFIIAAFLSAIYGAIMILTGLVLLAYFFNIECDPLKAGYIKNRNQLMPYFVMQTLSFLPGLPGLYMATIFSGALSTLSSGINSLTANTVEDFLGGVLANKRESTVTAISQCIVCAYGAGIIGLAYLVREMPGPVTQTTYTALGATNGPMLGIFVLGATFPQANAAGTMFGLLVGLAINMWMSIGSVLYGAPTPQLPYGPVDQCFVQNASVSGDTWNSSCVDHVTPAGAAVSSIAAYVAVATSNSTANGRVLQDSYSLYDVSYVWPPLIGLLITVLLGLLASIIFGSINNRFVTSRSPSAIPIHVCFFPFVRMFIKFETVDKEMEPLSDSSFKSHSKS